MVDIIDVYKSLNIIIGTVINNPEMLKFVPDHLKTKRMCKHAVKKLPYLIRCVMFLIDIRLTKCVIKNQEMCNKAVDNYPHA